MAPRSMVPSRQRGNIAPGVLLFAPYTAKSIACSMNFRATSPPSNKRRQICCRISMLQKPISRSK